MIFRGPDLIRRVRNNPQVKIQPSGLTPGPSVSMDAMHAAADAIPMLVRSRAERRRVFLRSRSRALVQSGAACEGLDTWTTLPWNRATDLVDKDMSRSKARQVESYVDGHAVG